MKRVKIQLKEFTNPEFLSPEKMKDILGGVECNTGSSCDVLVGDEQVPGTCEPEYTGQAFCFCHTHNGALSPQIECYSV